MFKTIFPIFIGLALIWIAVASCGSSSSTTNTQDSLNNPPVSASGLPKSTGEALIAKSDCARCHHISNKLVGPSYSEIAHKYTSTPENIAKLAYNIINGVEAGKGDWGKLPMPAHSQLSKNDAEDIVKYILSVKQ